MKKAADTSCPIAQQCGGCSHIHIPYSQQLSQKQKAIEALFAPLVDDARAILPIQGMDSPWRYRNKITSPFAPSKKGPSLRQAMRTGRAGAVATRRSQIVTGLYAAGTHNLIQCDNCPVEHESGRRIIAAVRQIMARYRMEPYNEDTGHGFVRHVVVRVGAQTGEVLVTIVTNGREFTGAKNFCRELVKACPEVTTIVQNVNTRQTNVIFGEEEQVLYGPGFILDTLCGLSFRISSNSFFQVNAVQTERLYSAALTSSGIVDAADCSGGTQTPCSAWPVTKYGRGAEAGPEHSPEQSSLTLRPPDELVVPGEALATVASASSDTALRSDGTSSAGAQENLTILDAFCGTGTIGLVAAAAAPGAQVIGVDSVEAAIADARQNAVHNGIENARFIAQDAGEFMRAYAELGEEVDVVFMDPPRAGASEDFLQALIKLAPKRIVYISCNPETQVRDARVLAKAGYTIDTVQPVDMFPHTSHVETVCLLGRRNPMIR